MSGDTFELLKNISYKILNSAKNHQSGRVTSEVTNVTFEFTEYWEVIKGLKEQGKTNREISEVMGDDWSESKVKDYSRMLNKVDANFLTLAKSTQVGRASQKDANAFFEYSEGWFRGLVGRYNILLKSISTSFLDLCKNHQEGRVDKNSTTVEFRFTEGWFLKLIKQFTTGRELLTLTKY